MPALLVIAFLAQATVLMNIEPGPGKPLEKIQAAVVKTLADSNDNLKLND